MSSSRDADNEAKVGYLRRHTGTFNIRDILERVRPRLDVESLGVASNVLLQQRPQNAGINPGVRRDDEVRSPVPDSVDYRLSEGLQGKPRADDKQGQADRLAWQCASPEQVR